METKKILIAFAITILLGVGIIMVIKYGGNQQVNELITNDKLGINLPSTLVTLQTAGIQNLKDASSYSGQPQYNYGTTPTVNILNESGGSNRQRHETITFNFSNSSIPAGQVVIDSQLCLNMSANEMDAGENVNVSVFMVYNNWSVNGLDGHVAGNSDIRGGAINLYQIATADTTDGRLYTFWANNESAITSCLVSAYNTDFRGVDINSSNITFQTEYGTTDVHITWNNCTLIQTLDVGTNTPNPEDIAINETEGKFVLLDPTSDDFEFYWNNGTYISTYDIAGNGYTTGSAITWFGDRIYVGDSVIDKVGEWFTNGTFIGDYISLNESFTGNGGVSGLEFNSSGYLSVFDGEKATMYVYNPSKEIINSPGAMPWVEGTANGGTNTVRGAMTYNKQPKMAWLKLEEIKPFYTVATSPINTWYCWNVTSASQYTYTNNYANLTFYIKPGQVTTNELTDAIQFHSKESTVVTARPYLNVTYDVLTGGDTCTYSSGDWNIDCSDNCLITSNVDVGGNDITITGTGTFTTTANITNFVNFLSQGTDSSNKCIVRCLNGGCFKE